MLFNRCQQFKFEITANINVVFVQKWPCINATMSIRQLVRLFHRANLDLVPACAAHAEKMSAYLFCDEQLQTKITGWICQCGEATAIGMGKDKEWNFAGCPVINCPKKYLQSAWALNFKRLRRCQC
jgi:hypothetical protein